MPQRNRGSDGARSRRRRRKRRHWSNDGQLVPSFCSSFASAASTDTVAAAGRAIAPGFVVLKRRHCWAVLLARASSALRGAVYRPALRLATSSARLSMRAASRVAPHLARRHEGALGDGHAHHGCRRVDPGSRQGLLHETAIGRRIFVDDQPWTVAGDGIICNPNLPPPIESGAVFQKPERCELAKRPCISGLMALTREDAISIDSMHAGQIWT